MPGYPPLPHPLVARGFARYLRGLAGRHFAALHWNGAPAPVAGPVLFVANHTNWWDGFLACLVSGRLGLRFQVLMETANLERYRVFRWVGALPLDRAHPRRAHADLGLAAARLAHPGTGLWIFPQGGRRPAAAPVTALERGAAQLAVLSGPVTIWPVAFRYGYLAEQLPEAWAWLGTPFQGGAAADGATARARRAGLHRRIESALHATVAALDDRLAREDLSEMQLLQPGRLSVNKRVDRVRHALGLLRGPFEPRHG